MVILGFERMLFGSVRMLFGGFDAGHGEGKFIFASESLLNGICVTVLVNTFFLTKYRKH